MYNSTAVQRRRRTRIIHYSSKITKSRKNRTSPAILPAFAAGGHHAMPGANCRKSSRTPKGCAQGSTPQGTTLVAKLSRPHHCPHTHHVLVGCCSGCLGDTAVRTADVSSAQPTRIMTNYMAPLCAQPCSSWSHQRGCGWCINASRTGKHSSVLTCPRDGNRFPSRLVTPTANSRTPHSLS